MNVILEFNRKRQERDKFIEAMKTYIEKAFNYDFSDEVEYDLTPAQYESISKNSMSKINPIHFMSYATDTMISHNMCLPTELYEYLNLYEYQKAILRSRKVLYKEPTKSSLRNRELEIQNIMKMYNMHKYEKFLDIDRLYSAPDIDSDLVIRNR